MEGGKENSRYKWELTSKDNLRQGAYRNPLDESTALFGSLGSQFDMTTVTLPHLASGDTSTIRGQKGGIVSPKRLLSFVKKSSEV